MEKHYIIRVSAACMPSSCWGRYARIGVLEVPIGVERVDQIKDIPSRGIRVVKTWERLNVGTTEKCAFQRALAEAEKFCDRHNYCQRGIAASREGAPKRLPRSGVNTAAPSQEYD